MHTPPPEGLLGAVTPRLTKSPPWVTCALGVCSPAFLTASPTQAGEAAGDSESPARGQAQACTQSGVRGAPTLLPLARRSSSRARR